MYWKAIRADPDRAECRPEVVSASSRGRAVTTAPGAAISGESGHQSRVRPGHAPPAAKPLSALVTVRSQSRHGPIAGGEQLGKLLYVAHRAGRALVVYRVVVSPASSARTTPSALGCSHRVYSPLSVARGPAAVASPRPSAAGVDRSPAKASRKRCGPARPTHRAACSGVWHDTWADGSFEARSVVTGPGTRISAGWEQSSAETRGFLDARVRGVGLRWESKFDRVRSPHDRHTYQRP